MLAWNYVCMYVCSMYVLCWCVCLYLVSIYVCSQSFAHSLINLLVHLLKCPLSHSLRSGVSMTFLSNTDGIRIESNTSIGYWLIKALYLRAIFALLSRFSDRYSRKLYFRIHITVCCVTSWPPLTPQQNHLAIARYVPMHRNGQGRTRRCQARCTLLSFGAEIAS